MKDCTTCIYNHLLASDTEAAGEPCVSCVDYDRYVERRECDFAPLPEAEMPCVEYPEPDDADYCESAADHDELECEGE